MDGIEGASEDAYFQGCSKGSSFSESTYFSRILPYFYGSTVMLSCGHFTDMYFSIYVFAYFML